MVLTNVAAIHRLPPLERRAGDGERDALAGAESRCRRAGRAADCPRARRRRRAASAGRRPRSAGSRAIVRASSPRLSSESGSAHSCIVSPKPFGDGGDQNGWRSCRSTGRRVRAHVAARRTRAGRRRASPAACGTSACPRARPPARRRARAPRPSRSPSLERNARATRSTAAGGGSSLTKCVTSLVRHERAPWTDAGRARGSRARLPRRRPRRSAAPSTVLLPGSCSSSLKDEADRAVGRGPRAPARRLRPPPARGRRAARCRAAEAVDRPAGQNACQLLHVLLRVAAVHAERVQLHQLARVVLVQSAPRAGCPLTGARAARDAGPIDWKLSRYTSIAGCLAEASTMSSKRPSTCGRIDVALVAAGERRDQDLCARRDAEMIRPERDEPLDERPVAGDARRQRRRALRRRRARPACAAPAARSVGRPAPAMRRPRDGVANGARRGAVRRTRAPARPPSSCARSQPRGSRMPWRSRGRARGRIDSAREASHPRHTLTLQPFASRHRLP